MIAEIRGYGGKPEYIALRWDGARWIPVRGDRGRHGEGSREDAIALCVRHLQRCMVGTAEQAKELHALCDRRGRPPTEREDRRMRELASCLARTLESAVIDLLMLLEAPSINDSVVIEATHTARERQTADRAFLGQVTAAFSYASIATGQRVSDQGIADAIALLERLRADRNRPTNGNGHDNGHDNGGDDS
jgi:hypothetical protein